jgi:hypothetical protein
MTAEMVAHALREITAERGALKKRVEELEEAIRHHRENLCMYNPDYEDYKLWEALNGAGGSND